MKTYEFFTNNELSPWEKYDFFIYAPHAWYDKSWIPFIKQTLINNNFSDEILYSYMKHEADLWTRELSFWIYEKLKEKRPDLKILLILWIVPRAFCDLNRIPEVAIPKCAKKELWQDLNDCWISNIENLILNSKAWLHLHTMNSRNNTINWHFWPDVSEIDLRNFLNNWYSWSERKDNILTHRVNWVYHSFASLDDIFIKNWEKNNIPLDRNIAYQFEEHFSATHLVSKVPSSLIEVTKGNLATEDTKHHIDASIIELDNEKIEKYVYLIGESILEFLK